MSSRPVPRASLPAVMALACGLATVACGGGSGGNGCLSLTGCGPGCSQPTSSTEWIANFASAPALIVNMDAPVLEARMRVGQQVWLLLVPRGASNVCSPPATWFSTNPAAASFEAGNPGAGAVEKPFGDAVLHGIAPGDTEVHVLVHGRRFDLVYNAAGNKRIGVVHVVP